MQVFSDQKDEHFEVVFSGFEHSGLLGEGGHIVDDFFGVLRRPEIGHFSRVQDVVDILEEGFLHDLGIRKQKDDLLVVCACLLEQVLEIVLPGGLSVVLGDFDGEDHVFSHEGGQARETLPAGPPDSDQQGISSGDPQNARNPGHVLDGIPEKDEVHFLSFIVDVIAFQLHVEFGHVVHHVFDLDVVLRRISEVSKDELLESF